MIEATIARLRATAMPPLTSVDGVEALEALGKGTSPRHGATFVAPFDERAEPNTLTNGFRQRVDVTFLVAVVLRIADDAKGSKRVTSADLFRESIEGALAGWTPSEFSIPYELVAARAAPQSNGVTWYVQTWRTDRRIGGFA